MNKKGLYTVLLAEKAKIQDCGEDAYSYSFKDENCGYIAVFDGCGGMGAKKYPTVDGKTGAFIGSHMTAFIMDNFYTKNGFLFDGNDAEKLLDKLTKSLAKLKNHINDGNGIMIKSNMFKELPTTASFVVMKLIAEDTLCCEYLWAGDSRGYYLNSHGMCQITNDDVFTDEDAFTSLRNDAKLKNVIHADGKFELHSEIIKLKLPTIVIVATDGVFGYSLTPMHFEYILLSALYKSDSAEEWEQKIKNAISEVTGDDFSFIGAVFGFSSFDEIKQYFKKRYDKLLSEFITPCNNADEEQLQELWNLYKRDYYRRCSDE